MADSYSMTAFATVQAQDSWGRAMWELRSVNHRYLDISLRLPESWRALEMTMREKISALIARGKVECTLKFVPGDDVAVNMNLNNALITQLVQATDTIKHHLNDPGQTSAIDILRWPGVLQIEEASIDAASEPVLALLDDALTQFNETRAREGKALVEFLIQRLDGIEQQSRIVQTRRDAILLAQREKIQARIDELNTEVDQQRLEQELLFFAQKIDIAEEIDRLSAHVTEVRRLVEKGGVIGRRLDFLMQELNREANTIASKSSDSQATQAAVELKVLIEQMREQVQNME